jgi:RNA polymerase sigma factor (sigma-70 family)
VREQARTGSGASQNGNAGSDTVQTDWPEDALYEGLLTRDAQALEALIRRYSREVTYFIRVVLDSTGTVQDAEECLNDLFVTVWLDIESFDPARGSLRTWLTMRAKYIALDKRRQILRRQAVAMMSLEANDAGGAPGGEGVPVEYLAHRAADISMERLIEQRERSEELRSALRSLPELDRLLVYMRYFKLANTEEICAKTGLSRHAIDTRLWRARKALRDTLEELRHERVRARSE